MTIVIGAILVLIGLVLAYKAFRTNQTLGLIRSTPSTPLDMLSPGFRETRGQIKATGQPALSPMTNTPCVYYRFQVEREVHNRSKDGKSTSTSWRTEVDDKHSVATSLVDGERTVAVDLDEAQIEVKGERMRQSGFLDHSVSDMTRGLLDQRYGRAFGGAEGGLLSLLAGRSTRMRYTENALPVDSDVYVLGTAQLVGDSTDQFRFTKGENGILIVSNLSEDELTSRLRMNLIFLGIGTLLLLGIGIFVMTLPTAS